MKILKVILLAIGGLITAALIAASLLYVWPTTSQRLQTATPETISYENAVDRIKTQDADESSRGVKEACRSKLLTHGKQTEKAVVLFHGITACPEQLGDFAQKLYDEGYNVYIPLAPHHGLSDAQAHQAVVANELADYAEKSTTITTGLGRSIGTIGLSGGAVVATWAAQYRPEITRLLVLSPFYEPAVSQAPKWQLPLLKKLHGYHILSNQFSSPDETGISLRALANYLILVDNFKQQPSDLGLKSIASVVSASDDAIDHNAAFFIPGTVADANNVPLQAYTIPKEWGVGHAITSPDEAGVSKHKDALFSLYLDLYQK